MESAHHIQDSNKELDQLVKSRNVKWYKGSIGRLNLIIVLLLITSMTNGYDGSMMNGLQTLDTWQADFGKPTGSLLGIFNAIQSIGGIAGLPFAPFLSDRLGRRATIFIGSSIMLVGTAIQTASQNIAMFIIARFCIGFGLSFACLAAPILITELAYPTHRAPLTSLYNSTWYLGSIVAAWTTFGTFRIDNSWSWRVPSLLQGLPSMLQFVLIFFIPESPRWLMDKGKEERATQVLAKYHCDGNFEDPLLGFEVEEIKEALRIEKEANASSSYKSLFVGRGNLKRMRIIIAIAFFSQWSGNGIVSYYFNLVLEGIGITTEGQKTLLNGILQVYNLGTAYLGAMLVDRVGRRPLFLISTAGMCVSYAVWTICSAIYAKTADSPDPNTGAGRGVLACIFFYYLFYNLAMSPLLVSYTVEILPFRIRSKGLMVMNLCVNASLVFNQYANPVALDALDWKYYIVYTCWIAFEFVFLYFYLVETKGKNGPLPLEEIAQLFDGEDKRDAIASAGINNMGGALPAGSPGEKKDELAMMENVERVPSLRG